jgi:hypothetical protein
MCVNDYGIKRKVILTWNPQANAIVERAHQMLGNLIRSFQLQDKPYYDPDDPWGGILVAITFALRSTYKSRRCLASSSFVGIWYLTSNI